MVAINFIIIFMLSTTAIIAGNSNDYNKYFYLAEDKKEILLFLGEYKFRDISDFESRVNDNILNEFPYNLETILMLGEYHYRITGNIEETHRQFHKLSYFLKQIEHNFELPDDLNIEYIKVRDHLAYLESDIQSKHADFRFKIRDLKIPRFSYVNGAKIILQIPNEVKELASKEQLLRLENIEDSFIEGDRMIFFTNYDSLSEDVFFSIPDFPLVSYRMEKPYVLIINNEKRYHFDFNSQSPPVEIDWIESWQLVETVPENEIKIEFSAKQSLYTDIDVLLLKGMSEYSTDFSDESMKNIFFKIQNNEKIDIHLKQNYRGKNMENALRWTSFAAYITSVYLMVNEVKDWE
ncbi:hypothetical protein KAJ27_02150 [bacterium]|nr:hypothetical protein [bacterium]